MTNDEHEEDEELHNSEEELHNSQEEETEQQSDDYVVDFGGHLIYYSRDPDGKLCSSEFSEAEFYPNEEDDKEAEWPDFLEAELYADEESKREGEQPKKKPIFRSVLSIDDTATLKESSTPAAPVSIDHAEQPDIDADAGLQLHFSQVELDRYIVHRKSGLAKKSQDWINRSSEALWDRTRGEISHHTLKTLREQALKKYRSVDSHSKVLSFAVGFLKFLAQTRIDPRYLSFEIYLERPRVKKVKKAITERIVTREDIAAALQRINAAAADGSITPSKARNFHAFALLAAYTGLRPSTIQRLTVGQFRATLNDEKPVLHILAEQEKNRIEHYVPLHPSVVSAISEVLARDFDENDNATPFFMFHSFEKWLERQRIPLPRVRDPSKARLWLSDFRKFAEQFGDTIGWDTTNRKYVLAHGMTGVDWEHYKHPLPEDVYDTYMRYWRDVELAA